MFRTSGHHKNRGLSKMFFEKLAFRKKNAVKNGTKIFQNLIFAIFFKNRFYSVISNLNVECFQLSFDIHIVHVGQKMTNFQKLWYRKAENFRGQSSQLRCRLTAKLCNLG